WRSQRRERATRRHDRRGNDSRGDLVPLVGGAVVLVNHAKLLGQAKQTFRMPNKEVSAGIQTVPKLFDQALLLGFVEINHDIATEDDVVTARQELRFQVVKVELHEFLYLRLDLVFIARVFEIE